jgi:hypothetical protein
MCKENKKDENEQGDHGLNQNEIKNQIVLGPADIFVYVWDVTDDHLKEVKNNHRINKGRNDNDRANNEAELQLKGWIN